MQYFIFTSVFDNIKLYIYIYIYIKILNLFYLSSYNFHPSSFSTIIWKFGVESVHWASTPWCVETSPKKILFYILFLSGNILYISTNIYPDLY
jgi:hypothetical protein